MALCDGRTQRSLAEQTLAAVPDEVDVYYNAKSPREAYLHTNTPRLGYALLAGGAIGFGLAAVAALFG